MYCHSACPFLQQAFRSGLFLLALFIAAVQQATAAGATPEDLDAWSDWVLDDIKDYGCPVHYNANTKQCSYPGHLELELDSNSGTFSQIWTIYRDATVYLPGDREHWPLNVNVDGRPVPVVSSTGRPAIRLDSGEHTVKGTFEWQQLPESLMIPAESGLVSLRLSGTTVIQPDIRNGQLWLSDREVQGETARRVDIRVFRKITDAVPLHVTTRIELEVSGEQREINLSGAVPDGFEAVAVDSRIPARLDDRGHLALKVRPGRWVVNVSSRLNRETLALTPGTFPQPWPASELWVFEARPNLRMLEVEDPPGIDASQSALPEDWKHLPAYRMQAGATMAFRQIRRGDPLPEPDQLTLTRELWLDFSGDGYTVSDHIGGTMSRGWRINAGAGLEPGQVTLDGKPQLITRTEDGSTGIEVRQGNINLAADSRIEKPVQHISATGWEHDFSTVSASLNVPPGYRVIAITGADRTPGTWLSRWTLLDFFIVLITSIALSKIHGIRWGAIGLIGLVALWHEPGAPGYIWLNLIATLAIMRALRDTRVYPFARSYLFVSSLALVLLALPFMVDQVRNGIYPQLEHAWQSMGQQPARPRTVAMQSPALKSITGTVAELDEDRSSGLPYSSDAYQSQPSARLDRQLQDPDARLQTGPGLPEWTWRNYPISWNGPVHYGQMLSVYLINPPVNLFLNLFRVCIVLLLAWKLIRDPVTELLLRAKQATAISLIALLAGGATIHSDDVMASYPPQELLQELRKRLLEPVECLPQCAELEHLAIQLDREQATFSIQAHAMENLALPLPVPLNDWTPSRVSIDGGQAMALFRDRNDTLWLYLDKGVHDIVVQGRISHLRAMRLDFPLPPHRVEISLDGWSSDGAEMQSPVPDSMTFTREQTEQSADVFETHSEIPAFARISRHLRMGIDWQLVTTVRLESGTALPARLRIPLLDTEAVVTDHIQVEDNHVHVSLSESSRSVSWQSTLEQKDTLTLKASQSQPWSETWSMEVTPIWNVSYSGIPVIYHQRTGGQWNPEWRPWPGEQVSLTITRPQGIEGQTKTIEHSQLSITPGKRASTVELAFTLRSSQGQQHTITLPRDSTLQEVSIDGKSVPIRQDGRHVTLPLSPGSQDIHIKWKEARGIDWRFSSPEVDLGIESVNSRVVINHGYDRWVLLTGGIKQGPAVLFWGVLFVVVLIAIALGRFRGIPLRTHSWILLGIGLSTVTPFTALLIAVWIFALYARCQMGGSRKVSTFNMIQIMLVVLTIISVVALFDAVSNGLLGNPDMQIAGNGSTRSQLNWYQDRLESTLPQAWIISLPVLVYRILMLAWSMWMAFALINWLKWGWSCFSRDRLWMAMRRSATEPQGSNTDRPATDSGS